MNEPSMVSSSDIPAANSTGRHRIAYQGSANAEAPPARTSSETSVAVSKPSPNSRPTRYICQGLVMVFMIGRRMRLTRPRLSRCASSSASSKSPVRILRKTRITPIRTTVFSTAMIIRKAPETLVPMIPV